MTDTKLFSVPLAARSLGVSEWTVFALIRKGELQSVKIGARRLVSDTALQEYVARLAQQAEHGRANSDIPA